MIPSSFTVSHEFRQEILLKLSPGILTGIISSDPLIIKRGEFLFSKHQHLPHRYVYIRCKLREMACFLLTLTKLVPTIENMAQVIYAKNYYLQINSGCQKNMFF